MGNLLDRGPGWSRVSFCLKASGLFLFFASSTASAGDHLHRPKVYVPVMPGYAPLGAVAGAPIGQPVYLYPVGAAPTATYGMPMSTVAGAPTAGYMMSSASMVTTVANAPQPTIVQVGSAPAAATNGGVTWPAAGVGNAPTAVASAPPAAPAEAHLKDEGKRMDVFNDLKDAYPAIRNENPDSRVNRRIKLTAEAKKLFATAIGTDFNADTPDAADQTDIDQMVSAIMKADPYYTWPTTNGMTGAWPATNGAFGAAPAGAPVYYMYPQPQPQPPLVPYVPVPVQHHHHLHHLLHK
jgi:hypothetical protein